MRIMISATGWLVVGMVVATWTSTTTAPAHGFVVSPTRWPLLQRPMSLSSSQLHEQVPEVYQEEEEKQLTNNDLQQQEIEKPTNDKEQPSVEANEDEEEELQEEDDEEVEEHQAEEPFSAVVPKEKREVQVPPSEVDDEQLEEDRHFMQAAVDLAGSDGGERGPRSAFPNPTSGAILVSFNGKILGEGRSDYRTEAVRACLEDAGLQITPLSEWAVNWHGDAALREAISSSTLYLTLEPSTRRRGTAMPPITNLIVQAGISRVVVGCASPVPEKAMMGASQLHMAGIAVTVGVLKEECQELITEFAALATCKLQTMARKHFQLFGRPLGFLHCSVVESDNIEAFARQGNAFGTAFGGQSLSYRNLGTYELAPPPDVIWVDDSEDDGLLDDEFMSIDFEEEDYQGDMDIASPMMPWYEQCDAVVATFPRSGNGPPDDDSVAARLRGLKWLATHGCELPAGVERIIVLDATDLRDLPISNDDPNLPKGVDIERFWAGVDRKPTRVLLRRGVNEAARAAAKAAAKAAKAASAAADAAAEAIASGDAARAAEAALECQEATRASQEFVQKELEKTLKLRRRLEKKGVIVDTIEGGEPIDVMKHLGERNGLYSVVWRAGCWGQRGVEAIMAGAFQWVSAHLAVDAIGGRFWQLMLAENAVQAACGPRARVKIFADQDDISLEYCDDPDVDKDCTNLIDGKPVRLVRLDARVGLVDENRPREFVTAKTQKLSRKLLVEQAPWFL